MMNLHRILLMLCFCLLGTQFYGHAQKAYEAVYYHGSTNDFIVQFTLADGYIGASEIKMMNRRTQRSIRFIPASGIANKQRQLQFDRLTTSSKMYKDHFLLEGMEEAYVQPPRQISGRYYSRGKTYPFTLKRR